MIRLPRFQRLSQVSLRPTSTHLRHLSKSSTQVYWQERVARLGDGWVKDDVLVSSSANKFDWLSPLLRSSVGGARAKEESVASASAATKALCSFYDSIDAEESRVEVLRQLAKELSSKPDDVQLAIDRFAEQLKTDLSSSQNAMLSIAMKEALKTNVEVFCQNVVTHVPDGVGLLMNMRRDVLQAKRAKNHAVAELNRADFREIDIVLKSYLTTLFKTGLLEMRRISLDSPGTLLEKVIDYEKVHVYQDLSDLKRRFGDGRRCFAFFHPSIPDEPLIFVHVALVDKMAPSMRYLDHQVAEMTQESDAQAAIFYSISATQKGLQGVDLGVFLIKRVVDTLRAEIPGLRIFSTLSPIPGFTQWLYQELRSPDSQLLTAQERSVILAVKSRAVEDLNVDPSTDDAHDLLLHCLHGKRWVKMDWATEAFQKPLTRLAARYLGREKRSGSNKALCSVANFHIRNGAVLERINWEADTSSKGLRNSCGMMVNYNYILDSIDRNSDKYFGDGTITMSFQVKTLLAATEV